MNRTLAQNNMKTIPRRNNCPNKLTERMKIIALMDISGYKGVDIARAVRITPQSVYNIRSSPFYKEELEKERERLRSEVIEKQSDRIVKGDPVEVRLKGLAGRAVDKYASLLNSKNEGIKKSTADSILDRAGYKAFSEKTKVSVEVTEKMASRFEEALNYDPKEQEVKVKQEKEV